MSSLHRRLAKHGLSGLRMPSSWHHPQVVDPEEAKDVWIDENAEAWIDENEDSWEIE